MSKFTNKFNYNENAKNEIYRAIIVRHDLKTNKYDIRLEDNKLIKNVSLITDEGPLSVGSSVYIKNPFGDLNRIVILGYGDAFFNDVSEIKEKPSYPVGYYGIPDPNITLRKSNKAVRLNTTHNKYSRFTRFADCTYFCGSTGPNEGWKYSSEHFNLFDIRYFKTILCSNLRRKLEKQLEYDKSNNINTNGEYPYLFLDYLYLINHHDKTFVWALPRGVNTKYIYNNSLVYSELIYPYGPHYIELTDNLFIGDFVEGYPHPRFKDINGSYDIYKNIYYLNDEQKNEIMPVYHYSYTGSGGFESDPYYENVIIQKAYCDFNTGVKYVNNVSAAKNGLGVPNASKVRLVGHGILSHQFPFLVYNIQFIDERARHISAESLNRPPIAYKSVLLLSEGFKWGKKFYAMTGPCSTLNNGEGPWLYPGKINISTIGNYFSKDMIQQDIYKLKVRGFICGYPNGNSGVDCLYPFKSYYLLYENYCYIKILSDSVIQDQFHYNCYSDSYNACLTPTIQPGTKQHFLATESLLQRNSFYMWIFTVSNKFSHRFYKHEHDPNYQILKDKIVDYTFLQDIGNNRFLIFTGMTAYCEPGINLYYYYRYWDDHYNTYFYSYSFYIYNPLGWQTYCLSCGSRYEPDGIPRFSHPELPVNFYVPYTSSMNEASLNFIVETRTNIYNVRLRTVQTLLKIREKLGQSTNYIHEVVNDVLGFIYHVDFKENINYYELAVLYSPYVIYGESLPRKHIDDYLNEGYSYEDIFSINTFSQTLLVDYFKLYFDGRVELYDTIVLTTVRLNTDELFYEEDAHKYGIKQDSAGLWRIYDITKDHIILVDNFNRIFYIPSNITSSSIIQEHSYSYFDQDKNLDNYYIYPDDLNNNGLFDIYYSNGKIYSKSE